MACSHTKNCELFPQFALNPALKVWQIHYCEGEHTRCARYQLSLEGKTIPLNLLPNGKRVETPRSSSAYGAAALFNAILKDRAHMVDSLLRTGVNVDTRNAEGMTPLMAAASIGNPTIIRQLLAKGSDLHATNLHGASAYDIAMHAMHSEAAEVIAAAGGRSTGAVPQDLTAAPEPQGAQEATEQPEASQSAHVLPLPNEWSRSATSGNAYCLRIPTNNALALAQAITRACTDCFVAIEAMVQKPSGSGELSGSVIVLTGLIANQEIVLRVVRLLEGLETVSGPISCMRLEALATSDFARTAS